MVAWWPWSGSPGRERFPSTGPGRRPIRARLMSKAVINEILPDDLRQHRAVKAWEGITARQVAPERIEILKLKNKSAVYRLVGVGLDGSSVIAKRCRRATAGIERRIYEEFLPRLPLPRLEYYA